MGVALKIKYMHIWDVFIHGFLRLVSRFKRKKVSQEMVWLINSFSPLTDRIQNRKALMLKVYNIDNMN